MESIYLSRVNETKKLKLKLQRELNVKLKIVGKKVVIDGKAIDEYDAMKVFEAIGFGFSVSKALMLKEEDFVFRVVHIKDHTRRNLRDIKSRLIGKRGKTRRMISEISGCEVLIKEGEVGIIGEVSDVEDTLIAVVSLIKGSKEANMYKYLEKRNRVRKKEDDFDI